MDGANLPATSRGIIAARQDRRWLIHSSFFRICDAGRGTVTDCSSISPHPISNHRLRNPKSHRDLGNPVPFFNWLQSRSPLPSNRVIHKGPKLTAKAPSSPRRRAREQDLGNLIGWKCKTSIGYEPSFLQKAGCLRAILSDVPLGRVSRTLFAQGISTTSPP